MLSPQPASGCRHDQRVGMSSAATWPCFVRRKLPLPPIRLAFRASLRIPIWGTGQSNTWPVETLPCGLLHTHAIAPPNHGTVLCGVGPLAPQLRGQRWHAPPLAPARTRSRASSNWTCSSIPNGARAQGATRYIGDVPAAGRRSIRFISNLFACDEQSVVYCNQ